VKPSVGVIVAAAGSGSRLGRGSKALVRLHGRTTLSRVVELFRSVSQSIISRSIPTNGVGRKSTPSTTEKMAVLAPMPSASVSTAATVKPGLRRRVRRA